jgi:tetratricopeptide (TPR) repeat protein
MHKIDHIRELTRRRRHPDALSAANDLAAKEPANADALYLLAANQRCLNLIPDALKTLARLERAHPDFSRLYQERGFCFLAMHDSARAIRAFQQGVTLNPALLASWSALEYLYRVIGDSRNAAAAAGQVADLKQLPGEIVQAGSLFSEGFFAAAEALLRAYIKNGTHIEALRLLARIEQQRDALYEAERLLQSVVERAPDYRAARADYARVLLGRQKYFEAHTESAALLRIDPDNADYRSLAAVACAGLGDHESAISAYRGILDHDLRPAHLQVLLGHSLKALGRKTEAIEAYHAARVTRPDFGDAYWSLANLKTYRFFEGDIVRMRAAIAAGATQLADRIHLHFALGKALESAACYEESWQHYDSGNALKRTTSRYRQESTEVNAQEQVAVWTRKFVAERAGVGAPDPDPIFIVGLPRSGSTLIEQILASHPLVEGTQELHIIPRMIQDLQESSGTGEPRYPGVLSELAPDNFRELGERYLTEANAFRKGRSSKPFFIDKLPGNFGHVGLIQAMLPNAKIVDVRREPMACCFSNFKQLYAAGNEFSYDLECSAHYYRAYLGLMQHWNAVLPGRVHRIVYEDVVADLEASVRGLLDFCGLKFELACVEFHKTARSIGTPSSEQVRQPLNRDGLDQWTHYQAWLRPLEAALGDATSRYRLC